MNIDNKPLEKCSMNPITGYNRDGYCNRDMFDHGKHLVCAQMDKRFLDYTETKGNPLRSVVKEGDKWCLCEDRYYQAYKAKKAPKVIRKATNKKIKKHVKRSINKRNKNKRKSNKSYKN
jgi:hypothetical protein